MDGQMELVRQALNRQIPWNKETVQALLDSWMVEGRENGKGMFRALQSLFARQTQYEQSAEHTRDLNGVGFNGLDAPFLSSVAKRSQRNGSLTPKQTRAVGKTLKKYWKQLAEIANAKAVQTSTQEVR